MNKPNKKLILFAGLGAAACYGVIAGTGALKRFFCRREHEAVTRYVDSHYKGAAFSPIEKTDNGFVTIVTTADGERIALTFTEADRDVFVFSEKSL